MKEIKNVTKRFFCGFQIKTVSSCADISASKNLRYPIFKGPS